MFLDCPEGCDVPAVTKGRESVAFFLRVELDEASGGGAGGNVSRAGHSIT